MVITFVDISDRLQAEQALRQSEQTLRQERRLVELSREPIVIWDFDDGIVEWNRGSEELYGYRREEALGKKPDQLLATQVPGSSVQELRADACRLREAGRGELVQRTKDGRELTVEAQLQLETLNEPAAGAGKRSRRDRAQGIGTPADGFCSTSSAIG